MRMMTFMLKTPRRPAFSAEIQHRGQISQQQMTSRVSRAILALKAVERGANICVSVLRLRSEQMGAIGILTACVSICDIVLPKEAILCLHSRSLHLSSLWPSLAYSYYSSQQPSQKTHP